MLPNISCIIHGINITLLTAGIAFALPAVPMAMVPSLQQSRAPTALVCHAGHKHSVSLAGEESGGSVIEEVPTEQLQPKRSGSS